MAQATLKRPAPPAVKETRLFIDNKWVEPAEGKHFDDHQPRHRRGHRQGGRRHRPRRGQGRQGRPPRAGVRAVGQDGRRRPRQAAVQAGRPDREERRRAGRPGIAQLRQDHHRFRRRHGGRLQHAPLLRRLGRQDRRQDRARARLVPVVHAAAAGRRRRPDHPLELPAA